MVAVQVSKMVHISSVLKHSAFARPSSAQPDIFSAPTVFRIICGTRTLKVRVDVIWWEYPELDERVRQPKVVGASRRLNFSTPDCVMHVSA